MYKKAMFLATVILCTSFLGCAGTGVSGGKTQRFNKTLGLCGRDDLFEGINNIVYLKNHYLDDGNSRALGSRIDTTTDWRKRFAFPDEKALGIVAVESRIIIFAKSRQGSYVATFQAENRVRYQANGPWQNGPVTADAKAYFNDIVDDLVQQLKAPY